MFQVTHSFDQGNMGLTNQKIWKHSPHLGWVICGHFGWPDELDFDVSSWVIDIPATNDINMGLDYNIMVQKPLHGCKCFGYNYSFSKAS